MDLHPEEAVLSEAEDEERERSDQDLQIRRTVTQVPLPAPHLNRTEGSKWRESPSLLSVVERSVLWQVVHTESQENGQKEAKRSRPEELEEDGLPSDGERTKEQEEKMDASAPAATESQCPADASHDVEISTGNGAAQHV